MPAHRTMIRFCFVLVWLFGLCTVALAQSTPMPVQIGQNAVGAITAEVATAEFTFSATGSESATLQALALTPGFAPRFRVVNPAGIEALVVANPESLAILTGSATFEAAGSYTIEVSGENGSTGQFVLSVQPGAPQPPANNLQFNQLVSAAVSSQMPLQVYQFETSAADQLTLQFLTQSPNRGVLVSLFDEDTHRMVATNDAELNGVDYHFAAGDRHYRLEVRASGTAGDTPFSICLGICANSGLPNQADITPDVIAVSPTPAASEVACAVASGTGGVINVRSGPGTRYAIIASLTAGQSYPALGQLTSGGWYEASVNGQPGWVSASVTRLAGECGGLAAVAAPVDARLAPTQPAPTAVLVQPSGPVVAPTQPPPPPSESGSAKPSKIPQPTTVPLPDLIVEANVSWALDTDVVTVSPFVSNRGDASSPSVQVLVCLASDCRSEAVPPLDSDSQSFLPDVVFNYQKRFSPITHAPLPPTITMKVDPDNAVQESRENNNEDSSTP